MSHVIHSRAGRIGGGAETVPIDIDAIVSALSRDPRKHLIVHFHGGLVCKESGFAIAEKLQHVYSPVDAGGYPVFFVWESGAWETIRNNITELAHEPVFKQLLRKALQYSLEQLGGCFSSGVGRSLPQAPFGTRGLEVQAELDAFWAAPSKQTVPFRGFDPALNLFQSRSASLAIDDAEIQADLEIDLAFLRALSTLPDLRPSARSSFATSVGCGHRSAFSELASQTFSKASATRGLVELYEVAKFLAEVVGSILNRYATGRDHGLYATCVEEIIRGFKLAGSGLNEWAKALQWNRMKQDTADAFGADPDVHAGTALLTRLQAAFASGLQLDRITLVGHSTGAVYISHWLEHSRRYLPETLKQDVVFLAPAITYDEFNATLRDHGSRIGNFRMFALNDEQERDDQVWGQDDELPGRRDWRRFIYPSSLLYLVSGILESRIATDGTLIDQPDMPILGMERFLRNRDTYSNADFPSIAAVRQWFALRERSLVWSAAIGQDEGINCDSIDHGGFGDNASMTHSLRHIVERGF